MSCSPSLSSRYSWKKHTAERHFGVLASGFALCSPSLPSVHYTMGKTLLQHKKSATTPYPKHEKQIYHICCSMYTHMGQKNKEPCIRKNPRQILFNKQSFKIRKGSASKAWTLEKMHTLLATGQKLTDAGPNKHRPKTKLHLLF